MREYRCKKYPELTFYALNRMRSFQNGVYRTSEPNVIRELEKLKDVEKVETKKAPAKKAAPKKAAPKKPAMPKAPAKDDE